MRTTDVAIPDFREQKVAQPHEGGEGGVRGGLHHSEPQRPRQNHTHRVLLLQQESMQLWKVDARRHLYGAHRRHGSDFCVQRHEVHPKSAIVIIWCDFCWPLNSCISAVIVLRKLSADD